MKRRHLTALGTFEVYRPEDSPCIEIRHVPTGMGVGGFSHLAVRTFKAALEGLNEVEALLAKADLALLDLASDPLRRHHAAPALIELRRALEKTFPNGGWAR